jgi:1,4-alpha-glucan branching enzyme
MNSLPSGDATDEPMNAAKLSMGISVKYCSYMGLHLWRGFSNIQKMKYCIWAPVNERLNSVI